jgi:predicted RNase H-like HicB family nuclease
MSKNLRTTAEKLSRRPYNVRVILDLTTDGQPVYLAQTPELEGCFGQGDTIDNAVISLHEARVDYILSLLEDDLPVPEPSIISTNTSVNLTSILTLSYKQIDAQDLYESVEGSDQSRKPLRLYEGAIRAG